MKKISLVLLSLLLCVGISSSPTWAVENNANTSDQDSKTSEKKKEEEKTDERKEAAENKKEEVVPNIPVEEEKQIVQEVDLASEPVALEVSAISNETELIAALNLATGDAEIVIKGGSVIQLTASLKIDTSKVTKLTFKSDDGKEVILNNAIGKRHLEIIGDGNTYLAFSNIILSGSTDAIGGGIDYSGNASHTIDGLIVKNNTLKFTGWYEGFIKVTLNGGSFNLINSHFENNKVLGWKDGNGLSLVLINGISTEIKLDKVSFVKNETLNQEAAMVALYPDGGNVNLSNLTLTDNKSAGQTAGIYGLLKSDTKLNLNNSIFNGNELSGYKGGALKLELDGTSTVTMSDNAFTSNFGYRGGGAIALKMESNNVVTIKNSTFGANHSSRMEYDPVTGKTTGEPSDGGAIAVDQSSDTAILNIIDSQFRNNKSHNGGALHINNNSGGKTKLLVDGSLFDNNLADFEGGAIKLFYTNDEVEDHLFTIKNTSITNNIATGKDTGPSSDHNGYGGGIMATSIETLSNMLLLDSVTFTNNKSQKEAYWNFSGKTEDNLTKAYAKNVLNTTNFSKPSNSFVENFSNAYNGDDVYYIPTAVVNYKFDANIPVTNYDGDKKVEAIKGSPIVKPIDPIAQGYEFIGWLGSDGKLWDFDNTTAKEDVTNLTASFRKEETYSVNFETNGGTPVQAITNLKKNSKIDVPTPPTKSENTFDGWYKDQKLTMKWDFDTDTVTSNTTLYAKWNPIAKYSVTFDSNGGTKVPTQTGILEGSLAIKPQDPTKNGFTFVGWYFDQDLTSAWDFDTNPVMRDVTLYAKWKENVVPVVEYTVTFDSVGGSTIAPLIKVPNNTLIKAPKLPTKASSVFKGWYKDANYKEAWDFANDKVTQNITLYAKWDKSIAPVEDFTVTFDSVGGSSIAPLTKVPNNSLIKAPKEPTKDNNAFKGWYKDAGYKEAWDFTKDKVTKNTTLYAKWEKSDKAVDPNKKKNNNVDTGIAEMNPILPMVGMITSLGLIFVIYKKKKEYTK